MHNFDKMQRILKISAQLGKSFSNYVFSKAKITRFETLHFKKENTEHDR